MSATAIIPWPVDWDAKCSAFLSRRPGFLADDPASAASPDPTAGIGSGSVRHALEWADALLRHDSQDSLRRAGGGAGHGSATGGFSRVVRHPLAQEDATSHALLVLEPQAVLQADAAYGARLRQIEEAWTGTPRAEQRFSAVWRLLPDPALLPAMTPPQVKRLWRLLPASADAPHRTLWDRQALASALAGTADADGCLRPALLQFNLADTQPFVTRARRTQDLWAGSYLLSFLCWHLMRALVGAFGPDCILQPVLREQPLVDGFLHKTLGIPGLTAPEPEALMISNIPNIFTAIVPWPVAEAAAEAAKGAALAKWTVISACVRAQVEAAARRAGLPWDGQCQQLWERQTEDFLRDNLFWAAVPLAEADYGASALWCARLLADRKRVRDFHQICEPGLKCSLTGAAQAVAPAFPGASARESLARTGAWWDALAKVTDAPCKMAGRLRAGDRLGAVATVKRLAMQAYFDKHAPVPAHKRLPEEPRFDRHQYPSTAGIANAALIAALGQRVAANDPEISAKVAAYSDAVRALLAAYHLPASGLPAWRRLGSGKTLEAFCEIDGECLYEEFYGPVRLAREFGEDFARNGRRALFIRPALDARTALVKAAREAGLGSPTRYYAIIALDGDRMGEWINGSRTGYLTPALHQGFTAALSGFALHDARRIVEEEHAGKLLYAGGDDVLALLPIAHLLPVLDALYGAFRGVSAAPERQTVPPGFAERGGALELRMGAAATLSAGAVIVHESLPLAYAMEQARTAERHAKDVLGRDAFSVTILKRAGAPVTVGSRWRAEALPFSVPVLVSQAAVLMGQGRLSGRTAYSLTERPLENDAVAWGGRPDGGVPDALRAARRQEFLRRVRRRVLKGDDAGGARRVEELLRQFAQLAGADHPEAWEQTRGLLLLARTIAESDPAAGRERDEESTDA